MISVVVISALATWSCGSRALPARVRSSGQRDAVVAANAGSPADILDDCEVGFCIGVRGRGSAPEFELAWIAAEVSPLGIDELDSGRLCHGYTPGLYARSWEDVGATARIVGTALAAHDSSALVAVCLTLPSTPLEGSAVDR